MKITLSRISRRNIYITLISAALVAVVLGVILYFVLRSEDLKIRGSVVTNGYECSQIGGSILEKGGSAADAAIAAVFCEGVAMPAACGLGGGFLMTIYDKQKGVRVMNARETAPRLANETMFSDTKTAQKGPLSVAVPGELRGLRKVYDEYGKLPWKELIQPTIDLCKNGIYVTEYLESMMKSNEHTLRANDALSKVFINPATNDTYKVGDRIKRLQLAKTLELIAEKGSEVLYTGSLAAGFVKDIGGIIDEQDLKDYKPVWEEPIQTTLSDGEMLYTSPIPGSGIVLTFIMKLLSNYLTKDIHSWENWQKVIESFKFAYGKRTKLGDSESINHVVDQMLSADHVMEIRDKISITNTSQDPTYYGADTTLTEDHGTAHISVLAPNGDAVAVTTTINLIFGSGIMSPSTGIILNDQMDDFASPLINSSYGIPPSEANLIKPGRRPLSSMCPTVIVGKDGGVRLIAGAAGGTKITTAVAQVILKHLWFGMELEEAIDDHLLHHQLFPMTVQMEYDYEKETKLVANLRKVGHAIEFQKPNGFCAITSIANKSGTISASGDKRRSQSVYYVYQ